MSSLARISAALAIAATLMAGSAGAQTVDRPFTLQAALDEALARNPELIALRMELDVLRQRPAQERWLMPPMLEAQIWQWPIDTLNPARTGMYMLMAQQDLPGRGKRAAREQVAQKDVELGAVRIAVQAREVVAAVKRAYADLYVSRKAIAIAVHHVDLLRELADSSEARYAAGRISQQDVLKAVVEISRLREELVGLDERARMAEARLNSLLARPPDEPIGALADPDRRALTIAPADLQRIALERQPDLRLAAIEIEKAEAELARVDREYRPDFFVKGGYMVMPGERDAWTAGVGITWPTAPWSRGRLDAAAAEARAALAAARARREAAENVVRLAVHEAWIRVKAAERRAELLSTSIVPQSDHTLEVSRAAYQSERASFLDLLENERALFDAELGYHRALADLEQARADLERASGLDLASAVALASVR
jgi:outer membrane protein TolC